jgi:hypothetical protein
LPSSPSSTLPLSTGKISQNGSVEINPFVFHDKKGSKNWWYRDEDGLELGEGDDTDEEESEEDHSDDSLSEEDVEDDDGVDNNDIDKFETGKDGYVKQRSVMLVDFSNANLVGLRPNKPPAAVQNSCVTDSVPDYRSAPPPPYSPPGALSGSRYNSVSAPQTASPYQFPTPSIAPSGSQTFGLGFFKNIASGADTAKGPELLAQYVDPNGAKLPQNPPTGEADVSDPTSSALEVAKAIGSLARAAAFTAAELTSIAASLTAIYGPGVVRSTCSGLRSLIAALHEGFCGSEKKSSRSQRVKRWLKKKGSKLRLRSRDSGRRQGSGGGESRRSGPKSRRSWSEDRSKHSLSRSWRKSGSKGVG